MAINHEMQTHFEPNACCIRVIRELSAWLETIRIHLSTMDVTREILQPQAPETVYSYVVISHKPFGVLSNDAVTVDSPVHLIMYQGTFSVADFAAIIKPLGAGELVALPPGTGSPHCLSWCGLAARCIFR